MEESSVRGNPRSRKTGGSGPRCFAGMPFGTYGLLVRLVAEVDHLAAEADNSNSAALQRALRFHFIELHCETLATV